MTAEVTTTMSLLETHFGHTQFRSKEQKEAVMTLIEGKHDIYVSMPTGRLCYRIIYVVMQYIIR